VPWFECRLAPGDAVVFYTDGITELFDAERRMFGLAGLDRAAARGGPNAIDIIAEIERDVRAHSEHSTDDQTLVVLERRGT
jgi:serine phosphatase RsbU (regulator of sigma subunit)